MKIIIAFVLLLIGLNCLGQSKTKLWYNKPANFFEETLIMGNGKVGASIFGGVKLDKIYLNDATLWSGEPVDAYMNPKAHEHIPAIREALANEDYKLAEQLNKKIQGKFSQSFAPLGTLHFEFDHSGDVKNYYRELDISKALSKITYEVDGVKFVREYFVSHADQVMIIKLSSSEKSKLNFEVKFSSLLKYETSLGKKTLKIDGYAPYHAEPVYRKNLPNPIRYDENRGTHFSSYFKLKNSDGKVAYTDSSMVVSDASEALLFVSIATSFNGFDKDPVKDGLNNKAIADKQLKKAFKKSYGILKKAHFDDYQQFFSRVDLNLGETTAPDLPTDERLKRYKTGAEDKNLEILYFQFGRYLLISSSRTMGVPANLQGIWNHYMQPPWSSNYTMNINLEENYWLAESTNLSEMHQPLLGFIENLAKTGAVTAKTFYGVDKGWASCHNSDIWAMSNPVGDFGKGDPRWACWNMSGAWVVTHLWEHYLYTKDKKFLKEKAYPLMKGAAEFCLNWMVEDKHGKLITSPSTSPENAYVTDKGFRGATLYGGTADLAIIRECFLQTTQVAKEMGDMEFEARLKAALAKLSPYKIGKNGNLQEWYFDWKDEDPKHRHQTHLYGLYPGKHITPFANADLANACKRTLEIKGDESTGWAKGWRINLWARLLDGDHAYKMYRELLRLVEPSGLEVNMRNGGGTYPNLLDAHPPFQIDGNFGGAAGVVEMLLHSHEEGIIRLLPSLPERWDTGSVAGIKARGNFVIDMQWAEGKLTGVKVESIKGGTKTFIYKDRKRLLTFRPGDVYELDAFLENVGSQK